MKRRKILTKLGSVALGLSMICTMAPIAAFADTGDSVPIAIENGAEQGEGDKTPVATDEGIILIENELGNGSLLPTDGEDESATTPTPTPTQVPETTDIPDTQGGTDGGDTDDTGETVIPSSEGTVLINGIKTDASSVDRTFSATVSTDGIALETTHKLLAVQADEDMSFVSMEIQSLRTAVAFTVYEYDSSKTLLCSATVESGQTYTVSDPSARYIAVGQEEGFDETIILTINGEISSSTEKTDFTLSGFLADSTGFADGGEYGIGQISIAFEKITMLIPSIVMDKASLSYLEDGNITVTGFDGNPQLGGTAVLTLNLGEGMFVDAVTLPTFTDGNTPDVKVYADDAILTIPVTDGRYVYVNKSATTLKIELTKDVFDFTQDEALGIAVRNITGQSVTSTIGWTYTVDDALQADGSLMVDLVQNTQTDPEPVIPDVPDPEPTVTPEPIDPTPEPTPETTPEPTPSIPDTSKDANIDVSGNTNVKPTDTPKKETTLAKETVKVSGDDDEIETLVATTAEGTRVVLDYAGTESLTANTGSSSITNISRSLDSSTVSYTPTAKVEKSEITDVESTISPKAVTEEADTEDTTASETIPLEPINGKTKTSIFDNVFAVFGIVAIILAGVAAVLAGVILKKHKDAKAEDTNTKAEDTSPAEDKDNTQKK